MKDRLFRRGLATEAGSRVLEGFTPEYDATAVRRLREAGAVVIGKLATNEFGCGQDIPATRNAWSVDHDPGGSSMGSAVSVALGSAMAALGTDAAGSVRKPASLNGVVGLVPSFGRVSRFGTVAGSDSLDRVGILARTVQDCATILEVIAGYDPADAASLDHGVDRYAAELTAGSLNGVRLGVDEYFFGPELDSEVRDAVGEAVRQCEALGATLVGVRVPALELAYSATFYDFHRRSGDETSPMASNRSREIRKRNTPGSSSRSVASGESSRSRAARSADDLRSDA